MKLKKRKIGEIFRLKRPKSMNFCYIWGINCLLLTSITKQLSWVILNKFYFILRRFEAKRSNRRVLPEISRDKTAVIALL